MEQEKPKELSRYGSALPQPPQPILVIRRRCWGELYISGIWRWIPKSLDVNPSIEIQAERQGKGAGGNGAESKTRVQILDGMDLKGDGSKGWRSMRCWGRWGSMDISTIWPIPFW